MTVFLVQNQKDQPLSQDQMPKHVGIIMDGNGRWAKERGRPRVFGHRNGVDSVRQIVRASGQWGIQVLTLYTFSDENWSRPESEVNVIMNLLGTYLHKEFDDLDRNNVQLRTIGDVTRLSKPLQKILYESTERLSKNTGLILNLAVSYGGRAELVDAVRRIAELAEAGVMRPGEFSQQTISNQLYTKGLPDPDLIIRTSGEQRISNFLTWQSAYSELYFSPLMWPDFGRSEYAEAILDYGQRQRRFGKTGDQLALSDVKTEGKSKKFLKSKARKSHPKATPTLC